MAVVRHAGPETIDDAKRAHTPIAAAKSSGPEPAKPYSRYPAVVASRGSTRRSANVQANA